MSDRSGAVQRVAAVGVGLLAIASTALGAGPAGAASVETSGVVSGGTLRVTGVDAIDAPQESVELRVMGGGVVVMAWEHRNASGQTMNAGQETFTGVFQNVVLNLGTGDHDVFVTSAGGDIRGDLIVDTDGQRNDVRVSDLEIGDDAVFHAALPSHESLIDLEEMVVGDDLVIDGFGALGLSRLATKNDLVVDGGGPADLIMDVDRVEVGDDLVVATRAGNDEVSIDRTEVGGDLVMDMSEGKDLLVIVRSTVVEDLVVDFGPADDQAFIFDVVVSAAFALDGGDDFDRLETNLPGLDPTNVHDFEQVYN